MFLVFFFFPFSNFFLPSDTKIIRKTPIDTSQILAREIIIIIKT